MANICITGIWHQGTVVSACLADLGNIVWGICDEVSAATLNDGRSPVFEPELPEIIQRNLDSGRLSYTSDYEKGLQEAEFVFISTDTPVDENDDSELTEIYSIAENIGRNLNSKIVQTSNHPFKPVSTGLLGFEPRLFRFRKAMPYPIRR